MVSKNKVIKIGVDLDGVIIDKPLLVPKGIIERLYRSHKNKKLVYRFPDSDFEKYIRWLSHHYIFRPPIRENISLISSLKNDKNYKLYAVSSRYSFLEDRTEKWLKKNKVDRVFTKIYLNIKDEQPHLFKEKQIKKLNLDMFIDDDLPLVNYLKRRLPKVKIIHIESIKGSLKGAGDL